MMMEYARMAKAIAGSVFNEESRCLKALYALEAEELRMNEKDALDSCMVGIRKRAKEKLEEALQMGGIKNPFSVGYDVYFQLQDPVFAYINWDEAMNAGEARASDPRMAYAAAGGAAAGTAIVLSAVNTAGTIGGFAALCLVAAAAAGGYGLIRFREAKAEDPAEAERRVQQAIRSAQAQNLEVLRQWCAMLEETIKKLEV